MRFPTLNQFLNSALADGYTVEQLADIKNQLEEKIKKNKVEAAELKKYQEYLNIVESRLSASIDDENIQTVNFAKQSGIVEDSQPQDVKVM